MNKNKLPKLGLLISALTYGAAQTQPGVLL